MKKLNIKIEYILFSILIMGLILISVSFFRQLNFSEQDAFLERGQKVEMEEGDVLEQKFRAEKDGLSNLRILFGNRTLRDYNFIAMILADSDCEKVIATKRLSGPYRFNSKYLQAFDFTKISHSKNKEYCLKIKLQTEARWTLWRKIKSRLKKNKNKGNQKIRVFEQVSQDNDNDNGYVIKDKTGKIKKWGQNKILFQRNYKNKNIGQDFQQLNQRMSQYKPWFLKNRYLTLIFMLVIISTGGSIILLFQNKK